jgi:galactose mutarotase-like enzyme
MEIVVIENEDLRVGVMPDYGARVVSLLDKASGRDWILSGDPSPNTGEDAVYGADEAVGWDECFPTVAPWQADDTIWGRRLRDHGDVWGRSSAVTARTASALTTERADATFRFRRTLSLDGKVLTAAYEIENLSSCEMPYLWALHGLLAVTPSDRILIDGIDRVAATYLADHDDTLGPRMVTWPDPAGTLPFALDRVQPSNRRFAGKFYADVPGRRAAVGHGSAYLVLTWDDGLALGIWLNYGGWPSAGGPHHIALEPTSAPADHLGEALATSVPPGDHRNWAVTLTTSREPLP